MRFCVIAVICYLITSSAIAQTGNEWIHYDQQYFKIPVAHTGIYRLAHADLAAAGLPATTEPSSLKLFHRGKEQSIFVAGDDDDSFDPGDYIEFYGMKNDGSPDAELYSSPTAQPHTLYSLFSDTTFYYLTVGDGPGKRMPLIAETIDANSPSGFHWQERMLILSDEYSPGINYGDVVKTAYDTGEGWMSAQILQGETASWSLDVPDAVEAAGVPKLEILLTGRGKMEHRVELYAGSRLLTTLTFSGFQSLKHSQALAWSDVDAAEKITIAVKVVGDNGQPDRVSAGYIRVRYPAPWDMEMESQKRFMVDPDPSGYSLIEITNAPSAVRLFDVTDPSSVLRIKVDAGVPVGAVVPTPDVRVLFASGAALVPPIAPVTFRTIDPQAQDFVIITHPALRKPALGYTDPVKAYAEYRALPPGGGFDTLIVNIDQLYDQFNYGERSPLAIYHFMKFLASGRLPAYLFLIGKGLDVSYGFNRDRGLFNHYRDLVPSAGYPASDMLFTAGLSGIENVPAVATGRISASVPQDVAAYLNKVKEMEALPFNDLRRKNILHLSGGIFDGEPQLFRSYLAGFAAIAESYYLGAHVTPIAKQTTDLELINVADEVNAGVALVTFFGHSGPTTTDFDIGNVTDPALGYLNKGMYPLLLMNGCSIGSFFLNGSVLAENWVHTPDRGAIAVIAHSSLGFSFALRDYSSIFYETAMADTVFITKGLGDIQKEVAKRFLDFYGAGPIDITQVQQMVLLGDPAVKLFGAPKPDYEIDDNNLSITSYRGDQITALSDSFRINMVVRNFGQARDKPIRIQVERILPDNSRLFYDSVFPGVFYADTLSISISPADNGSGNNTFRVTIDSDNSVDEMEEDNNEASLAFFIPERGTKNLFPPDFAIVNSRNPGLTFQHTDVLSADPAFVLEFDTVDTFDSPYRKRYELRGQSLATQSVELSDADTLAYYWRTRLLDPRGSDSVVWDESTFTYIADGPAGWAQVHFPQLTENAFEGLAPDPEIRLMDFDETVTDLDITTFGSNSGNPPDSVSVKINGAEYIISSDFSCRDNTINLIAFDKKTAHPYPGLYLTWQDMLFTYGGKTLICGREPFVINSYRADELVMGNEGDLIHYVDNIPGGDSVILFNMGDAGYEDWPAEAKSKLGELGISTAQIDGLVQGEPVIILGRKGASAGMAKIIKAAAGDSDAQPLRSIATVTGRVTSGTIGTPLIGPASRWKEFGNMVQFSDGEDKVRFDIIGVAAGGDETVVMTDVHNGADLSSIDPEIYPFIRILFESTDETLVSSAQLQKWFVSFDGVPEGVTLYRGSAGPDSLAEGRTWRGDYAFVNVSDRAFPDSLVVRYRISSPENFAGTEATTKIASPGPGDTTDFFVSFPTLDQEGVNDLEVFVNPYTLSELSYDNNVVVLNDRLVITADRQDPVLDVTFNGRHLVNNDFVPSTPQIRVMLWDNNPYLMKKDTAGVKILLAYPCGDVDCPYQRIYMSRGDVEWEPETDSTEFVVNFTPLNLPEGLYRLRAEATDANGNPSGAEPYVISFLVAGENKIILKPPFPNPFYYTAHFTFIVTGDIVPEGLSLQVLDLDGKVVYFRNHEALSTGTHTIEWTGVDNSGNPLPAGIYFYRISADLRGKITTSSGRILLAR